VSGQKSNIEDFEASALPHLNDIFRTASGLLRNRTEAEDLSQDVYMKSFHRFEPGTNCRAWLFKILFHRLHHHRRKWFQLKLTKDADLLEDTLQWEPPVKDQLSDAEILGALGNLPEDYRAVVLLADVEEFSYKEVAATLDIPMGTVMSRLSRARRLLRAQLADSARSYGIGNKAGGDAS
jgi:RNA polymerase sigma-70 factor, ECF subfamily